MCTDIIIAFAAVVQAAFAVILVLVYIRRQTMVMEGQKELSHKIDESTKAVRMLEKYTDLSDSRESLWSRGDYFYRAGFRDYMEESMNVKDDGESVTPPDTFHAFVNDCMHFPDPFDPDKRVNLLEFVQNQQKTWDDSWIWLFVRFVYDAPGIPEDLRTARSSDSREELSRAQHNLAYFWHNWSSILDVCVYVQPDPLELVMLTWLEFARVLETNDRSGRPGKFRLFKLARDQWKAFERVRGQV